MFNRQLLETQLHQTISGTIWEIDPDDLEIPGKLFKNTWKTWKIDEKRSGKPGKSHNPRRGDPVHNSV